MLFVLPGAAGQGRLGLTATRKVGCAVVRNRARRLLREAFRRHPEAFAGWDIVVNVRASAARRGARHLEEELLALAARARKALARRGGGPGTNA